MQEHPAIRFLWLLPLVAVPVMAGVVLQIPDLYQDRKNFGLVAGFVLFAVATSWAFHQRKFKFGLQCLALASLDAVILLHMAFDFTKGLPKLPVGVHNGVMIIAIGIASLAILTCVFWKPRYAAFIIAGVGVVPMMLLLLASRIGLLIGWW
jgi:hypothetical protein